MHHNSTALNHHIKQLNSNNSLKEFHSIIEFALYKGSSIDSNLFSPLLHSKHPFYKGKSTEEITNCKGYIFSLFEKIGTDNNSLPYIIEALEISSSPFLVAAAAKSIRGLERSIPQLAHVLIEGFYSIQGIDQEVSFKTDFKEEIAQTTAINEILVTLKWFGKDIVYLLPELKVIEKEFASILEQKNMYILKDTIQYLENVNQPSIDYSELSLEECYDNNSYSFLNKTLIKKSDKSFTKNLFGKFSFNQYFSFFNKSLRLD